MKIINQILLIAAFFCFLQRAPAEVNSTSIEFFVDREKNAHLDDNLTLPPGTDTLRFFVNPKSFFARYRLEPLDEDWKQRTDTIMVRVVYRNQEGEPIRLDQFPANGRSPGWNRTIQDSTFTPRMERISLPPGAVSMTFTMSTAGPASLIGVYAIRDLTVTLIPEATSTPQLIFPRDELPEKQRAVWQKSGTHQSMASRIKLTDQADSSSAFIIVDDDLSAHADWTTTGIAIPAAAAAGGALEIRWMEAYSTGLGGDFTATYERLPAGRYRFVVEDLSLTGDPLNTGAAISMVIPQVFWKNFWFWGGAALLLTLVGVLSGRYLIRRRIRRHLEQERMISDERQRIALDLHDDIGTRVSHISLVASHADNTIRHEEANKAFGQISSMSRDLIGALSESVWMLNPNNDDLESLVDFLYRLVNELCRLKDIRCRVDAVFITESRPISYEFRHNVSLAVKESVNNVLKHSHATEFDMKIELEKNVLVITITDNGIGINEESRSTGLGLRSLQRRMKSIGGACKFEHLAESGLRIVLSAPVA